jgi:hypothetical protein
MTFALKKTIEPALRGVAKTMMRNFLETCATNAIQPRDRTKQEEEIYKFAK